MLLYEQHEILLIYLVRFVCVGFRNSTYQSHQDEEYRNSGASIGQRCKSVCSGQGKFLVR